jgi:hypothetical protein
MLFFFCFAIWIWILFTAFADLFRRQDIGGWGGFVYLIAEHRGMAERAVNSSRKRRRRWISTSGWSPARATPRSRSARDQLRDLPHDQEQHRGAESHTELLCVEGDTVPSSLCRASIWVANTISASKTTAV